MRKCLVNQPAPPDGQLSAVCGAVPPVTAAAAGADRCERVPHSDGAGLCQERVGGERVHILHLALSYITELCYKE